MAPVAFRAVWGLAALASVAAASYAQSDFDRYRAQASAPALGAMSAPALASAIAQWKAVSATDLLPFDSYASFLLAHPGWPGEAGIRRAAEKQVGAASTGNVVAFFTRFPPQTAAAGVRYAVALASTAQRSAAEDAARAAWRRGALAPADEQTVLDIFGAALAPADQDARMDALLWQGQTAQATRQIALVGPARRDLFAARLAFRTNAAEAAQFAAGPMMSFTDAGYLADRAWWLRGNGAGATARSLLALPHHLAERPGDPVKWLATLLTSAKAAAADGSWQLAYDIARQTDDTYADGTDPSAASYAERDAYTDLNWLGGQAALKHLGRAADAATLFERYAGGSRSPSIQSKGIYWAGRAAAVGGQSDRARAYWTRAAVFHDAFYGQLSAERLGQPLVAPPPFAPPPVDAVARATFANREVVQAARYLGTIGDWQDQTAFIRQIAADAHSDTDHVLAQELSLTLGRPDLGVMIGRSALQNGYSDYSLAGFPTVSVPATDQGSWTMIHAIARQESQFDRQATSRVGARGLLQLMPGTARDTAGKLGVAWDPAMLTGSTDYNIQLGAFYFNRVFGQFGSYPLAVAAYNAGPGNVNKWLTANGDPRTGTIDPVDWVEAIPFSETRAYVQHVLENAVVYDLANPSHSLSRGGARLSWYLGKPARPG